MNSQICETEIRNSDFIKSQEQKTHRILDLLNSYICNIKEKHFDFITSVSDSKLRNSDFINPQIYEKFRNSLFIISFL